jgi:hypothetical protein
MWEMLFERSQSKKKRKGIKMNGEKIDKWSEKHVGSLALVRTILGFVNVLLALVVIAKLFDVI